MQPKGLRFNPTVIALYSSVALLAACGGDPQPEAAAPPPAPTTVSGVAATGLAISAATVTLVDADAATANPAATTTSADGAYSFAVDGLKPPFSLKVVFTKDGESRTLYSVLPSAAANAANTANVTPLTNALAVLLAPGGLPTALEDPAQLTSALTGANSGAFTNAVAVLNAVLSSDPAIAAKLATAAGTGNTFNPVTTAFAANGTGADAVLDQLTVTTNPAGSAAGTVQIQNNLAPTAESGTPPAPVVVTPATTTATAPVLTPTASGDLPTAAELDAVAKLYNDCYALPSTQRVTAKDANGNATAIAPICDFAPADYKSNGYTWIEQQGAGLANPNNDGAVFQRPLVALVIPPANRTAAKEFKHPYCNTAQCVLTELKLTIPVSPGQTFKRDLLLAKAGGSWKPIGNQRPYDFDIQLRVQRYAFENPAPLTPTSYFSKSRFEGVLRTSLNPSGPGMNGVRAARVTGPGLPSLGLVLTRSSRCTSDRMPIATKNGDTYVVDNGINVPRYYSGNSTIDFKWGASYLNGSDPGAEWPSANVDFAATPGSHTQLVPYGIYKWEFFNFASTAPAEPDLIVYQRLVVSDTNPTPYVTTPAPWWATFATANIASYLLPGGSGAGALTDVALSWTVPASLGRVDSAYIFSQNNAVVNGVTYNKRTLLSPVVTKPGDATASITAGQTPWVSGTSTSTFTSGIAAGQNPRCSEADKSLVGITGVAGDYREMGLTTALPSGLRLISINYWNP